MKPTEITERRVLQECYRKASLATRAETSEEIEALDHLVAEGLGAAEEAARKP
jgi:hypothetical protein